MKLLSSILLRIADSPAWQRRLTGWRVTRRVVGRFIPGEDLADALDAIRDLNARGMIATLNPMGEHVHDAASAGRAADEYVRILEEIDRHDLDANLSVKLSLLGLDFDRELAVERMTRVLAAAEARLNFVRIDMESSAYVDDTLDIYRELRGRHGNVGVVIQSYLRRSADDIEKLVPQGASVRLVKGAYKEPPDIAFPKKADVDGTYSALMRRLLADDARAFGVRLAVATHDAELIDEAKRLIAEREIDSGIEFQMLYGIRRDLQEQLAAEGFTVRVYVSYGESWYPWFMRRLAERPANLWFFLRHLFK